MRHPWRTSVLVSLLSSVVCIRPAAAALSIVGANDATDIKITIDQPRFHHEIVLATDATEAKDISIATTRLNSAVTAVELRCLVDEKPCTGQRLTLTPLTGRTIDLDATITAPGTYSAFLTIIGGGARMDRRLVITRTAGALPIQVIAAAKLETTTGGATMRYQLQETSGLNQTVNPPSVLNLVREEAGRSPVQATYGAITASSGGTPINEKLDVKAGATPAIDVRIDGLDAPGHYRGVVRFSGSDARYVDQPLSIDVRRSMGCAVFWIALGVLLSAALRAIGRVRPWLVQQEAAAGLSADLDTIIKDVRDAGDEEKKVVQSVGNQLETLIRALDGGKPPAGADETLRELDDKVRVLRKWVVARRAIKELPSAVATAVRAPIDVAAAALRQTGLSATAAQTAEAGLDGLDAAIDTELAADLQRRIGDLRQHVQAPNVFSAGVIQRTQAIDDVLAAAANDAGAGRMELARAGFAEGQRQYAVAVAAELRLRIDPALPTPGGFTDPEWAAVRSEIETALMKGTADPAAAVESVRNALATFFFASAKALTTLTATLAAKIRTAVPILPPDKQVLLEAVDGVVALANQIMSDAVARRVENAAAAYTKATADFDAIKVKAAAAGVQMGGGAANADPAAPVASDSLGDLPVRIAALFAPSISRYRKTPGFFRRLTASLDLIIVIMALLLAIGSGVQLLWRDNMTWGSGNDIWLAVLWGLGMHQVSGNTFEGASKLSERFLR